MQRTSALLRKKFPLAVFIKRWYIHCPFNFKRYVGYDEIESYLTSLGAKNLGCTAKGRNIQALRVGDGPVCILEAGVHAREWASPMAALYVINKLLNEPPLGVAWLIVPLLNPDGYEYSRQSHTTRLWRKNMNKTKNMWCSGVDINRNFSVDWGNLAGCYNDPCMDTYCGIGPWSELESAAMKKALLFEKDIRVYLSVHACLQAIMYPPAHSIVKPVDVEELEEVALEMQKSIKGKYGTEYKVGQSSVLDRRASGSSIDWARQELGIKFAYNFELPGPDIGFLLPENEIERVGRELHEAVFTLSLAARSFQNVYMPPFKDK